MSNLLARPEIEIELTEAGTIDYYCRFHPNMKGRISVVAA